jgi:hypothetical protein
MVAADVPKAPMASTQRPLIRISHAAPLTLDGMHFVAGEGVRVVVRFGAKKVVRRLTVNAAGGFTLKFPSFNVVRCGPALSVSAVGTSGSKAAFDLRQIACDSGGSAGGAGPG